MSKKALSAKIDVELLAKTDQLAKLFKTPRNRAFEEGLKLWIEKKTRDLLRKKMKEASLATRKESHLNTTLWESTLEDGLDE